MFNQAMVNMANATRPMNVQLSQSVANATKFSQTTLMQSRSLVEFKESLKVKSKQSLPNKYTDILIAPPFEPRLSGKKSSSDVGMLAPFATQFNNDNKKNPFLSDIGGGNKIARQFVDKLRDKTALNNYGPMKSGKAGTYPSLPFGMQLGIANKNINSVPFAGLPPPSVTQPIANTFKSMGKINPAAAKGVGAAMGAMGGPAGMGLMMVVQVVSQLADAMNPFKGIMGALVEVFGIYGEILSTAFIPIIEDLYTVMLSPKILDQMWKLADQFANLFRVLITPTAIEGLITLASGFVSLFTTLLSTEVYRGIFLLMMALNSVLSLFADKPTSDAITGLALTASNLLTTLTEPTRLLGIISLTGGFSGLLTNLTNPTTMGNLTTLTTNFTNLFLALNNLSGNPIFSAYNRGSPTTTPTPITPIGGSTGGGGGITFNGVLRSILGNTISNFLHLANGGITSRPTLAVIGDNPSGKEAVIPLDSNGNPTNGNFGGKQINIHIYGEVTETNLDKLAQKQLLNLLW
jgi:hypothetical protein